MNTTYFLNNVAGNVFQTKTTPAIPTTYYLGLSTTEPQLSGSGVSEPSISAGYARVLLNSLSQPVNGVVTNSASVSFAKSTASWGVIPYFVIYDSDTVGSGNLLMYGQLSTSRTVEASTIMTIEAGDLSLAVQNPA